MFFEGKNSKDGRNIVFFLRFWWVSSRSLPNLMVGIMVTEQSISGCRINAGNYWNLCVLETIQWSAKKSKIDMKESIDDFIFSISLLKLEKHKSFCDWLETRRKITRKRDTFLKLEFHFSVIRWPIRCLVWIQMADIRHWKACCFTVSLIMVFRNHLI